MPRCSNACPAAKNYCWWPERAGRKALSDRPRYGSGSNSHVGYTLASKGPLVVIEDLKTETRFTGRRSCANSGIVSGLSVIIQQNEKTWGVMGAYTTTQREFTSDDATFLSAVAKILSLALDRKAAGDKVTRLATAVEQSGDSIVITDTTGNIQYVNPGFEQTTGYSIRKSWVRTRAS